MIHPQTGRGGMLLDFVLPSTRAVDFYTPLLNRGTSGVRGTFLLQPHTPHENLADR